MHAMLSDTDLTHHGEASSSKHPPFRPPTSPTRSNSNERGQRLARGMPSYLFSLSKRPRRNVVKRLITSSELKYIDEEEETLLGIHIKRKSNSIRDPTRAPRAALALFLFVCSIGGYLCFRNDWSSLNAASVTAEQDGDLETNFNPFRDLFNSDGNRVAFSDNFSFMSKSDNIFHNRLSSEKIVETEKIEDVPIVLFDRTVEVPKQLSNLANVFQEKFNPLKNKLFFWHIPRSGSSTIKRIASQCMGLTLASEVGRSEVAEGGEDILKIVEGLDGMQFANVDMSNPDGIARAKSLNVGHSDRIDLISSPYLYDVASIFEPENKGFMVAMFRHPIERAVSLYYNMRKNSHYEKIVGNLETVEQYAKSSLVENNWMTRFLSNTLSGQLTPEHEAIAKEVLRTKCLIGLLRDKTESMRRLGAFLNIKSDRSHIRIDCQEKLLYWDWPGKNRHEAVLEGSEAWKRLHDQNTFDIRLYQYAEQLFKAQGKLFQDIPLDW